MGHHCHADGKMMGSILRIGVPNACENSFFQLGRLIVVSMIALFGTVQTSANAVANTLDSVGIIIGQAMGLAMVTVVGQCVGAGDPAQVRHYVKKLLLWSYLSMAVCNALIIVFAENLISLYSSLSPQTVELTKSWSSSMRRFPSSCGRRLSSCPMPCGRPTTCGLPCLSESVP